MKPGVHIYEALGLPEWVHTHVVVYTRMTARDIQFHSPGIVSFWSMRSDSREELFLSHSPKRQEPTVIGHFGVMRWVCQGWAGGT
jgi:hypothetical protein